MPFIITSIHDPTALAATCRQCNVPAPQEGCIQLEDKEVAGWIVRLPGVRFPIVVDTLTGHVAYHPRDNAFFPYGCIMRFVQRYYAVRHQMRRGEKLFVSRKLGTHRFRRRSFASAG